MKICGINKMCKSSMINIANQELIGSVHQVVPLFFFYTFMNFDYINKLLVFIGSSQKSQNPLRICL